MVVSGNNIGWVQKRGWIELLKFPQTQKLRMNNLKSNQHVFYSHILLNLFKQCINNTQWPQYLNATTKFVVQLV